MPVGTFNWKQFRETHILGDWVPKKEAQQMSQSVGEHGPYPPFALLVYGSRGTALLQVDENGRPAARWCTVRLLPRQTHWPCPWGYE